jgi:hypothetical protein
MSEISSLLDCVPRVRITRVLPNGDDLGMGRIIWFGSVNRGWIGKPLRLWPYVTVRYGRYGRA